MSISCPSCESKQIVKNGKIDNGKQNYKCRNCGRQFVENRQQKIISQSTKNLIDKLLLEKIPLAGIARVTDVSEPWLQSYVNDKYESFLLQKNRKSDRGNLVLCPPLQRILTSLGLPSSGSPPFGRRASKS